MCIFHWSNLQNLAYVNVVGVGMLQGHKKVLMILYVGCQQVTAAEISCLCNEGV